jgi:hypothetical protein
MVFGTCSLSLDALFCEAIMRQAVKEFLIDRSESLIADGCPRLSPALAW